MSALHGELRVSQVFGQNSAPTRSTGEKHNLAEKERMFLLGVEDEKRGERRLD